MGDALLLARRFHAPSTAATSSSASSSPSFRWDFSPAALRGTRLAIAQLRSRQLVGLKVHASVTKSGDQPKWWEKNAGLNMIDIHSTQEFMDALRDAGDRLVIVEFYGSWRGSCRALFLRLCRTALENPEIWFLKVNFDENKPMCKRLNVKVLPFFHFYRGSAGQLEVFSCSLAKKLKDAIAVHNTARCGMGLPAGVRLGDVNLLDSASSQEKPAEATSR